MKKRFYVATAWENKKEAREAILILESQGWECTYDWTRAEDYPSEQSQVVIAVDEINAVTTADLVLILLPGGPGTHTEMGAAIASGRRIIAHDTRPRDLETPCPFYFHPGVEFKTGEREKFFKELPSVAKRRLQEWQ